MKYEIREAMKNQTIGVEIEMNNISRENAARVAWEYFGGIGSVEYLGGTYRIWACKDNKDRTWKFEYDSSIAGPEEEKCECVTPILRYDDIELLQGLIRALRKAGAKSCPRRGCGVHIHIGVKSPDGNHHTADTLRNLTNVMASHESLLVRAIGIDPLRTERWCRVVDKNFLKGVNAVKPHTMDGLADVWYETQGCTFGRNQHYNSSRYHMLNLHASFTKGTIEFRCFQFDDPTADSRGGLHAGKLKAYIQLCLALSNYAKTVRSASPKEPVANLENPKYVMRFWMKTLGMVGEEFATARKIFLDRLDGNSDCRTGNRENCAHRDSAA